jgi:hypothetical protein
MLPILGGNVPEVVLGDYLITVFFQVTGRTCRKNVQLAVCMASLSERSHSTGITAG